jgi:hypothetical protein
MTRSRLSYRRASSTLVNSSADRGKQKWRSFANRCTFGGAVIVRIAKANVASYQPRSKAIRLVVGRWRHQAIWRFVSVVQRQRAAEAGGQGGCAVGGQQRKAAGSGIIVGMYFQRRARPNPSFEATSNSGPPHAGKAGFAHSALPARGGPLLAAPQFER